MPLAGQHLERKSNLFGVLLRKVASLVISVIRDALGQFAGFCSSAVPQGPPFCVSSLSGSATVLRTHCVVLCVRGSPFDCGVVFHFVNPLQSVHPLACWQTSVLF